MHRPQHAVQPGEANDRSPRISTAITAQVATGSEKVSDTYSRVNLAGDHHVDSTGLRAPLDTELLDDFAHLWNGPVDQSGRRFPDANGDGAGSTDGHYLYLFTIIRNWS